MKEERGASGGEKREKREEGVGKSETREGGARGGSGGEKREESV